LAQRQTKSREEQSSRLGYEMNYSRGKPRGIETPITKSETRQAAGYSTQIEK
jgi:hypothetical protein